MRSIRYVVCFHYACVACLPIRSTKWLKLWSLILCSVRCILRANSTSCLRCFHRTMISSSSYKCAQTRFIPLNNYSDTLSSYYLGLLDDIQTAGRHVGRSDRFNLGHVAKLALIQQLHNKREKMKYAAFFQLFFFFSYRIKVWNDFVEESQTFEPLIVDRLFRIELCIDKKKKMIMGRRETSEQYEYMLDWTIDKPSLSTILSIHACDNSPLLCVRVYTGEIRNRGEQYAHTSVALAIELFVPLVNVLA